MVCPSSSSSPQNPKPHPQPSPSSIQSTPSDTNNAIGTLDVRIRASYIPPSLLSRFTILLTILRQLILILTITLSRELSALNPDVFVLDQLSYCIPLLRWLWPAPRVLFYCHFPDQLLARGREKWWKRVWRIPFDWAEGWSMRGSEKVVVNSRFTGSMVRRVFGDLGVGEVGVVYPCVGTDASNGEEKEGAGREEMWKGKKVILSINRFEEKKDVGLAIRAFAGLSEEMRRGARLVIAGRTSFSLSSI
jgi:alpha-1,3/alpha-1,6-mannosyltransferase